jgi:hypothetical protein
MRGDILPLPQYAFMVWCSVKAQGQLYLNFIYRYIYVTMINKNATLKQKNKKKEI